MKLFEKIEVPMKKERWGVWFSEEIYDPKCYQRNWYTPYATFKAFDEAADWLIENISTQFHIPFYFDWKSDCRAVLRDLITTRPIGYYLENLGVEAKLEVIRPDCSSIMIAEIKKYEV